MKNETPDVPGNETPEVTVNETDKDVDEKEEIHSIKGGNVTEEKRKAVSKPPLDEKATGNPLLALILALILVPIRRLKK